MVSQYIPFGFGRLGMSSVLENANISFARSPETVLPVTEVFGRATRALELFFGEGEPVSSAEEAALFMEAMEVFDNPSGLADGGAAYGISFHHLGAGWSTALGIGTRITGDPSTLT